MVDPRVAAGNIGRSFAGNVEVSSGDDLLFGD